jgi:hypothetical protein
MEEGRQRRSEWLVHGAVVAALATAYGVWLQDLMAPPRGAFDLRGLEAGAMFATGLLYAIVTTVAMIWVGRRRAGALVMHLTLLAGIGAFAYGEHAMREAPPTAPSSLW